MRTASAFLLVIMYLCAAAAAQVQESTHVRVTRSDVPGNRASLKSLDGATLYTSPNFTGKGSVPLIIHFHGAPWLIQHHVSANFPKAALITVQLGSGSSVYNRPFDKTATFRAILDEAKNLLNLKEDWSSVTLTAWSAGYGAVRAILRDEGNFQLVDNVLLLDGIHAGYIPEGSSKADGGTADPADLDAFVRLARQARKGKKTFVLTHSEIIPGTYASTTECVDHLLTVLGVKRELTSGEYQNGMRLRTKVDKKHLHVRGYAGDTAADHVDHIHAMTIWFALLNI